MLQLKSMTAWAVIFVLDPPAPVGQYTHIADSLVAGKAFAERVLRDGLWIGYEKDKDGREWVSHKAQSQIFVRASEILSVRVRPVVRES